MLGSILGTIGGMLGKKFGGGLLSNFGRLAGSYIGKYLEDYNDVNEQNFYKQKGKFLDPESNKTKLLTGKTINKIYGKAKIHGEIIWVDDIKENIDTVQEYIEKKDYKNIYNTTNITHFVSFMIAIAEGEIENIERIWINDEITDITNLKYRFYSGSENQMPDPFLESKIGKDKTPAFRSLSYIIIEDFQIDEYNNQIPNFSFEVKSKILNQSNLTSVESLISAMIMIPGCGEYIYDTIIQKKQSSIDAILNSHNIEKISDACLSLNQLITTCPNVKWVSPVVCWFANELDIKKINILPGVEHKDLDVKYNEEWKVAGFKREDAYKVSLTSYNSPNYGGTPTDASIIRYIEELKKRGLKIMLYPLIMVDKSDKPWRGHISGDPQEVREFFQKKNGYNDFIIHYAHLVKGKIDAFLIGSELKNLTKIKDSNNKFPVIDELINLARQVKFILGSEVLVSYAADWSEYHHSEGGFYNLDKLWADNSIDFIGIDAYFPLTNKDNITLEDIKQGWISGEGYDYYYGLEKRRIPLTPAYALKNIEYWWSNFHVNPDGSNTEWVPRSKKIWFTEYGFPSINKATNQPNVFYNPECIDGGIPKDSNGKIDFSIQRLAIQATEEFWKNHPMIGEKFLWCWDARSYPAFPYQHVWADSHLWAYGHWVNGKLGIYDLALIVKDLALRAGYLEEEIDVSQLEDQIYGLCLNFNASLVEILNLLKTYYFFDIIMNEGKIRFIKRVKSIIKNIDYNHLIYKDNGSFYFEELSVHELIHSIYSFYYNPDKDYDLDNLNSNYDYKYPKNTKILRLPLIIREAEVEKRNKILLKNSLGEKKVCMFSLPLKYIYLTPGDNLNFKFDNTCLNLRILEIKIKDYICEIIAVSEEKHIYTLPNNYCLEPIKITEASKLEIFELPAHFNSLQLGLYFIQNKAKNTDISLSFKDNNFIKLLTLTKASSIGKTLNVLNPSFRLIPDNKNVLIVEFSIFNEPISKCLLVGNECIIYTEYTKLENNIFSFSGLIRGLYNSHKFIDQHNEGERVIVINVDIPFIALTKEAINKDILIKAGGEIYPYKYLGIYLSFPPPINLNYAIEGDYINLKWVAQKAIIKNFWDNELDFYFKILILDSNRQIIEEHRDIKEGNYRFKIKDFYPKNIIARISSYKVNHYIESEFNEIHIRLVSKLYSCW